ncbi:MAG: methylmalonyl-CoA mutase [Deltaproteobacteria bacterium]|nr:methylmalonyl-CoA mutase [Deltaproteobacteria bacterium]
MFDPQLLEKLRIEKAEWEQILKKDIERFGERRQEFSSSSGIPSKNLYTPSDLEDERIDYLRDIGLPGKYPFTRGIYPNMYRREPFTFRIYTGFGTPRETNHRVKLLLKLGVNDLQLAADLPTQVGYDSDHIMSRGEVGKVGVAIDSLRDMEMIFDGIPLNSFKRVSTLFNSLGPIALCLFMALGEKQGLAIKDYGVDLQNDVIKEYVCRGTYIFPMEAGVRLCTDVVRFCAENAPHWYPMTICSNHLNAAGAGSTAATAFAIANGMVYIRDILKKGMPIDRFASLLCMFLDEREDFFITIANLRATRRLWARILKEQFGAKDANSMALKITSYSHGGETLRELLNNSARIAYAALGYVLGGVQFLYNASFDEAVSLASEDAVKVAVRTQQILAHELGITNTVDPLGGSYYIETLTNQIERRMRQIIEKVESLGGALEAIRKGYYQSVIAEGASLRQKRFEERDMVSVGVNVYRTEEEDPEPLFRMNQQSEEEQIRNLQALRRERNSREVQSALSAVKRVAKSEDNLVPAIFSAIKAYATVGEMSDVLREVFGEYKEAVSYL